VAQCSADDVPREAAIPSEVLKIAKTLEDAGFETWCVGGAIRDNLLAVENHDFDLTTAAPPAEVQKLFKRTVPVASSTARSPFSTAPISNTRSRHFGRISTPTAATPSWSSACR